MSPVVLTVLLIAAWPSGGRAQAVSEKGDVQPVDPLTLPRPSLRAHRITSAIRIDGRLDEAVWLEADSSTSDFVQIHPSPGYPASEPTTIRILYDDRKLYIGAVLYEAEPEKLVVPGLQQDFDTPSSDLFGVALDTYHDMRNGFVFAVNPAGAVFDAQSFNDQRDMNVAWEGIVDVRTSVGPDRWIVEMAIPFTTLRYRPATGEQVWGLSFSRRIRHLNEDSNWAPTPRQFRLYKFSMAGTLTGLEGLEASRNLWAKPYVRGSRLSGATHPEPESDGDVGLDLKWGITPRLTLDVTANTDFSQVEVDQEQVNLTRFSLFFPEKRDFFLENQGTFAFEDVSIRNYRTGSSPRQFTLFHSRRIGLSPSRTSLPIAGGARLTGKAGDRLEFGLLNMQTRSTGSVVEQDYLPAENFAVARVKADILGSSSMGMMFVNRQQTAGGGPRLYNRSWGVDGNFNLGNLNLSTYVAGTAESEPSGNDRSAVMVQAAWRDPLLDMSFLAKRIGDDFDPGAGFVNRTGVQRYYGTIGAHPQPRSGNVVSINPYIEADFYRKLGGGLETRTLKPAVSVQLRDGGTFTVEASDRFERLFEVASIAGVLLEAGTYRWREAAASYSVPGSHALSGRLTLRRGGFYDGHRTSVSATARWRPSAHLTLDVSAQHNDLELAGEAATADLYSGRIRWGRDVRTFVLGYMQYNESTDELITNVRFDLIHAPLSDLFLVYTERRSLADAVPEPLLERGITLKVTRLLAFAP